jgi:hypothetical protein
LAKSLAKSWHGNTEVEVEGDADMVEEKLEEEAEEAEEKRRASRRGREQL